MGTLAAVGESKLAGPIAEKQGNIRPSPLSRLLLMDLTKFKQSLTSMWTLIHCPS